jgi:hypothetical protein
VSAYLGYGDPRTSPPTAYARYFASPYSRERVEPFARLDTIGQGALEAPENYLVGYGQVAGQYADPNSNYYRYLLAQAGRLRNQFDYESLSNPTRTWGSYLGEHVPQLGQDWQQLAPAQRGESPRFAYGGGRWLG